MADLDILVGEGHLHKPVEFGHLHGGLRGHFVTNGKLDVRVGGLHRSPPVALPTSLRLRQDLDQRLDLHLRGRRRGRLPGGGAHLRCQELPGRSLGSSTGRGGDRGWSQRTGSGWVGGVVEVGTTSKR